MPSSLDLLLGKYADTAKRLMLHSGILIIVDW